MSNERASSVDAERAGAGTLDADHEDAVASALNAGVALVAAMRQLVKALRELAVAESRLFLAGIPLLFIAVVALTAISVSLWACVVALIGWALVQATHSVGVALGLLVVMHAMLAMGAWLCIKHASRQLTFPRVRGELRNLRQMWRRDVARTPGASAAPQETASAGAAQSGART